MTKPTGPWGIALAAVLVAGLAAILDGGHAAYRALSEGRVLPDFGLGVRDLAAHLEGLSDAAARTYLRGVAVPDLFYPAALALLLHLLALRAGLPRRLLWLPVLAALVDYAENAGIWAIVTGVAVPDWLGVAVSLATHLKFALYAAAVLNVLLHLDRVTFARTT